MGVHNVRLIDAVKELIHHSKQRVYRMANAALLETYWEIGKLIVEDEQSGKAKAAYGKATLKKLSEALTLEFGKGYDESNLRNIRTFYLSFSIRDALRHELSWTHYRLLSRLEFGAKRNYYLQEALTAQWNSRELQRQINALAFERVLKHLPEKADKPTIQNIIKESLYF